MKIIGVGRNYVAHIAELKNEKPDAPVVFLKPDTALLRQNAPFYYPDYSKDIHFECELVLRINREGKHIKPEFAFKYCQEIGLGIDFTARDLQEKAKEKRLPWAISKGFDGSAPVSQFVPLSNFADNKNIGFHLLVNGQKRQEGNTSQMIWSFAEIISYVSTFFTLKVGDMIFTGTPAGVGPVQIGDRLEGFIETEKFLDFEVK